MILFTLLFFSGNANALGQVFSFRVQTQSIMGSVSQIGKAVDHSQNKKDSCISTQRNTFSAFFYFT